MHRRQPAGPAAAPRQRRGHRRRFLPHARSQSQERNHPEQDLINPRGGDFHLATSGDRNLAVDTAGPTPGWDPLPEPGGCSPAGCPASPSLLHLSPGTAVRWVRQAGGDWSRHAAELARERVHRTLTNASAAEAGPAPLDMIGTLPVTGSDAKVPLQLIMARSGTRTSAPPCATSDPAAKWPRAPASSAHPAASAKSRSTA